MQWRFVMKRLVRGGEILGLPSESSIQLSVVPWLPQSEGVLLPPGLTRGRRPAPSESLYGGTIPKMHRKCEIEQSLYRVIYTRDLQ